MADLKTDYKDDILVSGQQRKYNLIENSDGTVSLVDVSSYAQYGDTLKAEDFNATNAAVNALNGKTLSSVSADYDCHVTTTGQQYIVANISSVHPQYEIAAVKMTEGNSTHVHDIYCFADGILATFEAAGDYKFHVVYFIKN